MVLHGATYKKSGIARLRLRENGLLRDNGGSEGLPFLVDVYVTVGPFLWEQSIRLFAHWCRLHHLEGN